MCSTQYTPCYYQHWNLLSNIKLFWVHRRTEGGLWGDMGVWNGGQPHIPVTTTSTRCHLSYGRITPPVGHRKVSKYSARSASCSVQVKVLQKKVTPNISCQLGLEVSTYNWQRVATINWWKLMFLLKLIHPSIRPKNLVSNVPGRRILDLTGNLTLLV